MIRVSTSTLIIANGNNLEFRGDMATRAVVARLDARCDRPDERTFRYDLKEFVPHERPRLVAAVLKVLRAFIVAGCPLPGGTKPLNRFEDWSRLVRGALLWLDQGDPVATRDSIASTDSAAAALACLHSAWQMVVGAEWQRPSDIIELADAEEQRLKRPGPLAGALSAACPGPRGVTPVALGRYLSKYANRRIDGRWITVSPNTKTGNMYRLMEEPSGGFRGV